MIVAIHQPNYLPWLGYFYKVSRSDILVFLDDVQFSKGSYTNRAPILASGGKRWLTVPVRAQLGLAICDVQLASPTWARSHLDVLRNTYSAAPAFSTVWPDVCELYDGISGSNIAAVNMHLITNIATRLDIACRFIRSSTLTLSSMSDDRLVEIVASVAPRGTYLSGNGAVSYQDPNKFGAAGLGFEYTDFQHPAYPQMAHTGSPDFISGLSILDAAFHLGWKHTARLIERRPC